MVLPIPPLLCKARASTKHPGNVPFSATITITTPLKSHDGSGFLQQYISVKINLPENSELLSLLQEPKTRRGALNGDQEVSLRSLCSSLHGEGDLLGGSHWQK